MHILMLSSTFPYPPSRGGTEIRTFNLLKYLQGTHCVTLITQTHKDVSSAEVEELRKYVSELIVFPIPAQPQEKNAIARLLGKTTRFVESVLKATPPNVLYRYSPEIQAFVDDYVRSQKCDVITCEHSVNEIYIRPEFRHRVNTVVDVHSSVYGWIRDHLEMGAAQNAMRDRLYLSLVLKRYEQRYCNKFSNIVVTTEDDRQEFLKLRPDIEIEVIPNGVDLELFPYRQQDPGGHKLIFVGAMDASHNIDAARFFAVEVLPKLQQHYPETTFSIVGARPTPEVLDLQKIPGVVVTGRVPSMAEYLHQSCVCVVPLRTGFGIKNKTLEAMASGVPVVASDRGLEGLAVDIAGKPLRALRANTPTQYVTAISELFNHPQLRHELSHNGRQLVETEFTWDTAGKLYEQVLLQNNASRSIN
ncbi:glycosyltransferase [Nostoc sp. FACHB-152]|uniref:glycosyltransferase family 4 protein n=1 Tax=unclassified Nostoc TaxID=2593658 RepID=UPI001687EFB1|nr:MULTISPECIES: glycosyltransferase family 4 protein [unclassified Nostoc]MBD2450273.1 glycosyltransferase [Nostoc sp. FACHB-152]MBD2471453.1 glycosyltransferase [Nostoc sp. FACHB-145]